MGQLRDLGLLSLAPHRKCPGLLRALRMRAERSRSHLRPDRRTRHRIPALTHQGFLRATARHTRLPNRANPHRHRADRADVLGADVRSDCRDAVGDGHEFPERDDNLEQQHAEE